MGMLMRRHYKNEPKKVAPKKAPKKKTPSRKKKVTDKVGE
jgi:hypothetical protein